MSLNRLRRPEGNPVGKPKLLYVFYRANPKRPKDSLKSRLTEEIEFRRPRSANAYLIGERENLPEPIRDSRNLYFHYAVQFYRISPQKGA